MEQKLPPYVKWALLVMFAYGAVMTILFLMRTNDPTPAIIDNKTKIDANVVNAKKIDSAQLNSFKDKVRRKNEILKRPAVEVGFDTVGMGYELNGYKQLER